MDLGRQLRGPNVYLSSTKSEFRFPHLDKGLSSGVAVEPLALRVNSRQADPHSSLARNHSQHIDLKESAKLYLCNWRRYL